ncbi:WhiB family transcription factor [Streptomyces phage JPandJE]|nr:WhiB family transcription factor [Streptomyces phage JPandJE]
MTSWTGRRGAPTAAGGNYKMTNPYLIPDAVGVLEQWQVSANCAGKAFELFEYQEKDSPLAKDMSNMERLAFNHANFELAAEICIECPVFFECGEHATTEDKYWTVRAGEAPERFAHEALQVEGKSKPGQPRTCQRGHYLPQGGRCNPCKLEGMKARREAQKNAVQ